MYKKLSVIGILTISMALVLGCGDDTADNDDNTKLDAGGTPIADQKVAAKAPEVSFSGLTAYTALKATATIKTEVKGTATKLELLADGKVVATLAKAPWEFSWDTTKAKDGIVKLSLKGHADTKSATSKETAVVVLNKGELAKWVIPAKGKIIVPASGYVEQHLRFGYPMVAGVTEVISILSWDKAGYELELAIGAGTCPESGKTAAKKQSKTSPVVVTYKPPSGTLPTTTPWFAHVDLMNRTEKAISGKDTPFQVVTYLLK